VAGTLCNVGKLVLAITLPDQADQITSDCQNLSILGNWQQAEQRHGFPQHTVLGEIGAVFWGLPEYVLNSSAFHHSPPTGRDKDGRFRGYNVVALANQIGHWVQLRPTEIDEIHFNKLCRYFGLNRPEAEKLAEEFLHLRTAS
jgi:HD-like signal output (HDOD) protein